MLQLLELMILDTLLDDIESFESILQDLNSPHFTYRQTAHVDSFSGLEVKDALAKLLSEGFVRALEQTENGLERRGTKRAEKDLLEYYWFELTEKGRQLALKYQW